MVAVNFRPVAVVVDILFAPLAFTPVLEVVLDGIFALLPRSFGQPDANPEVDGHVFASFLALNNESKVLIACPALLLHLGASEAGVELSSPTVGRSQRCCWRSHRNQRRKCRG